MAKACAICGKTQQRGNNVSHANNKTNRFYKPNLQSINVIEDGKKKKISICTRCLRTGNVVKAV